MIIYQCKKDNINVSISTCPICKERTDIAKAEIYWCDNCKVPLYEYECGICKQKGKRIGTDIRPVFPEERLLIELILDQPFSFINKSVWNASGNHYFVDGKKIKFSIGMLKELDTKKIRENYLKNASKNNDQYFQKMLKKFINANEKRFLFLLSEASAYIRETVSKYDIEDMFVSFSGGKDSTVVSDLVMRALTTPKVLHIFGDTTLEFPDTYSYVERFKKAHYKTPVLSSRNKEKNFKELCNLIGPPSRVMRWCCTIFKTGAITRKIKTLFKDKKQIITFYGIRRSESASRNKYDRESDSPKITKQITISPIIDWFDFDVWLYILSTGIDFNDAYRLGYARVGCWCCPNNSGWSEFLSKIHMPEEAKEFRTLLVEFAIKIGKPDAENYIDEGFWKARQGGNGVDYAQKSYVSFKPCTLEQNSFNYELQKVITEELYEFFKPFGYLDFDMGNQRLGEVYVLNKKGQAVLRLQGRKGSTTLKVTLLTDKLAGSKNIKSAEEKIKCQITKFQMCMGCLACESICRHNAISIKERERNQVEYKISDKKCTRCTECVAHFSAGCYMRKVLTIKRK